MDQFPQYDESLAELDLRANTNKLSASITEDVAGPLSSTGIGVPVVDSPRSVNTAQLFACADEEVIFKRLSLEEKRSYIRLFMRGIDHMIFECAGTKQQKTMLEGGKAGGLTYYRLKGLQVMMARIWLKDNLPNDEAENITWLLQQWNIDDGVQRIQISQRMQSISIQQKSLIGKNGECSRFLAEFQERAVRKVRAEADPDKRDIGLFSAVYQAHLLQKWDSTWHVILQPVLTAPQQMSITGTNMVPGTCPISRFVFFSESKKAAKVEPTVQGISVGENSGVMYTPREEIKRLEGCTESLLMSLLVYHVGRPNRKKRIASYSLIEYNVENLPGTSPSSVAQWVQTQHYSTNGLEVSGQPASWDSYGTSPRAKDPPEPILVRTDKLLLLRSHRLGKEGLDIIHEIEDVFLRLTREGRALSTPQRQEMDERLKKLEETTNKTTTFGARSAVQRYVIYEGSLTTVWQTTCGELWERQKSPSPSSADGNSREKLVVQGSGRSESPVINSEDMAETEQEENMFLPEVPGLESMEMD